MLEITPVKIALSQMKVVPGDIYQNLQTMQRFIADAIQAQADLVVFSEMCTHGYLIGDKWLSDNFCRTAEEIMNALLPASEQIAIAWGSIFLDQSLPVRTKGEGYHPNQDGRIRRYNAIYVAQDGQLVNRNMSVPLLPEGIQPKTLLPNYRIFDDQRYFFSLADIARDAGVPLADLVAPFPIKTKTGEVVQVLFEVCEDMWAKDYREKGEAVNITKIGIEKGAQLVVNLSASPWTCGKNDARDRRVRYLETENSGCAAPFLYVNCVGVQNNGKNFVTFDGGSSAYNHRGELVKHCVDAYEEALLVVDLPELLTAESVNRRQKPQIAEKYEAILQGIRSLQTITGAQQQPKFVIGLSGGIDSAVVCALLVKALGAEHIVAVNMPSQWNSAATQSAAANVAKALGVAYYQIPISEMVSTVTQSLDQYFFSPRSSLLSALAQENVQAKTRGTSVLSNIAGSENWLFTNNGNKLEIALGYATLYGDIGGSIAPIGDLLKTEVFELAHYLNETVFERTIIPASLLPDGLYRFGETQIKPSAELQANQEDPMKFGYHDALLALATSFEKWDEEQTLRAYQDGILHHYIGEALSNTPDYGLALMHRWGVELAEVFLQDARWFFSTIEKNIFKRVQAPGIVITSKSAYGYDIRESMMPYVASQALLSLRQKITDYHPRPASTR